jgi:hypothetical protein
VVLTGNTLDASNGLPQRVRLQCAVLDDATGPAPAGGMYGWTTGSITASGGAHVSRTPGWVAPFNYPTGTCGNGCWTDEPYGDSHTALTGIDATIGVQSPPWPCIGSIPAGQPDAIVYGRNEFVTLYEFTIYPDTTSFTVTFGGNLYAATSWQLRGIPSPPNCNAGSIGRIQYAPALSAARALALVLNVTVQPAGACCGPDGGCTLTTQALCPSGNAWSGASSTCTPNNCPVLLGRCCAPDTTCQLMTSAACMSFGGTFADTGSTCSTPCPLVFPAGACCRGASCTMGNGFGCALGGGRFLGNGVSCTPVNGTNPCCAADFNGDHLKSVQDMFDFLTAWFLDCP